jgi:hypothetical protein
MIAMGTSMTNRSDTSLVRHAVSARHQAKVTPARQEPLLWNLMWPIVGLPAGSFCFDNQPNMLDQHIATKNMATGDAPIKINAATVQVFKCRP